MIPAILLKDFYKTGHPFQYPENTTKVYSNFTARISRLPGINSVVVFGIQAFVDDFLIRRFNLSFFQQPKEKVIAQYKRRMDTSLGPDAIPVHHLEALHDLGYLPIHVKALPEGTVCPLRIPLLTITNTHPKFGWLTNSLETLLSNEIWHPITSATIALEYRKILEKYAAETSSVPSFVKWQGHDFSMRGQTCVPASLASGGSHLTSFTGTDTIAAIDWLEHFYGANADTEMIGGSIPATEHAVACLSIAAEEGKLIEANPNMANDPDLKLLAEVRVLERLLNKVYPKGAFSYVSDTFDFFKMITRGLPMLKNFIMVREGKLVIRPDSGDPETILCGDVSAEPGSPENKGAVRILWEIFGGTVNDKTYKELDSHIGLIYGDSITLERCESICRRLQSMGFASTNVVFGIGSYTYQYVTRDTLGFAMKATYGVIEGEAKEIFKDPVTDGGVKKSAKGLLRVNEDLTLSECVTEEEEKTGMLQTIFKDGHAYNKTTLADIRGKIDSLFVSSDAR